MGSWRFDLISAAIGAAAGVLLTLLVGWLRRPARRALDGLSERAQSARQWVSAGIEGRYREELVQYTQYHHLGKQAATLEKVYVQPRLYAPLPEPQPEGEASPAPSQFVLLWPELAPFAFGERPPMLSLKEMLVTTPRAVLLAAPGGGKSTALAFLAMDTARRELVGRRPNQLPIYAHFHELEIESAESDDSAPVETPLLKAIQNRAGTLTADSLPGVLNQAIIDGNALLLLDGWDELSPSERSVATSWLERLLTTYPENQIVMTGPLAGYGPLLALGFVPLTMAPWGPAEATELAERWSAALGTTVSTVRASQEPGAPQIPLLDFWQPGLGPLESVLGLWLGMDGEEYRVSPAVLFHEGLLHILAPLETAEQNWPLTIGEQVLGLLAREMAQNQSSVCTWSRLDELVREVLARHGELESKTASSCLEALGVASGLLVRWREQTVSFVSPGFWAYCWGAQSAGSIDDKELETLIDDPAWTHALSLWAEMSNPLLLIKNLLDVAPRGFHNQLFLAASWVPFLAAEEHLKRNVLIRLAQLMVNPKAQLALRQRAAAALVCTRDSGVGYLLRQAVKSGDAILSTIAAPALGALALEYPGREGDEKSLQVLTDILQDPAEDVQLAALHALAQTGAEPALEAIIHALTSASPRVRQAAAEALARMGKVGHQVLVEALQEEEVLTRRAALYGLVSLPNDWVTDKLREVQHNDQEWFVRSTAEDLLSERLEEKSPAPLIPIQPENLGWLVAWAADRGEGVPAGPAALAILQRVLQEANRAGYRAAAARSLGDIGHYQFAKPLIAAMRDPAPDVREAAFVAYAAIQRAWPAGSREH